MSDNRPSEQQPDLVPIILDYNSLNYTVLKIVKRHWHILQAETPPECISYEA